MAEDEKYTDQFLKSLDDEQLMQLVAAFPAEEVDPQKLDSAAGQRELLVRISAEMERRRKTTPPPS